jgi:hypothetical protein
MKPRLNVPPFLCDSCYVPPLSRLPELKLCVEEFSGPYPRTPVGRVHV